SAALDVGASGGADGAAAGAGGASAAVHVTIALTDLQTMTGFGEVLGSTATGTVLSPEVLRRISCEADLIPCVLGTAGEDLDQGMVVRLFTRAQRRRLWRRDRGCTYPGCTAPAAWTKAHHVRHWADGGPSDIHNAALLCQRHHTLVHQRRLFASVRTTPDELGRYVIWDLVPGSYDQHLQEVHAERSANDPPPLTPNRLTQLLKIVTGRISDEHPDDDDREMAWLERDWAAYQLSEHHDTAACVDADLHDQIWTPDLSEELERAS
ncbi:MAG: HNH endonuclease signature motif containing protein, partial [Ornithinibacter sp.]